MKPVELFHQDGRSAGVWYCSECRRVAPELEIAEQCCLPRRCACGKECERGWLVCAECSSRKHRERLDAIWNKAEKRNGWDWEHPVVVEDHYGPDDGFFHSVGELREWLEDEEKSLADVRVYATRRVQPRADADDVLERVCEEMHEGAIHEIATDAIAALQKMLDDWVEAHAPKSWIEDNRIGLVFEGEP